MPTLRLNLCSLKNWSFWMEWRGFWRVVVWRRQSLMNPTGICSSVSSNGRPLWGSQVNRFGGCWRVIHVNRIGFASSCRTPFLPSRWVRVVYTRHRCIHKFCPLCSWTWWDMSSVARILPSQYDARTPRPLQHLRLQSRPWLNVETRWFGNIVLAVWMLFS